MYPEEEGASIEAGLVAGAEEVYVGGVFGREKGFEGDRGVEEDEVRVYPPG